MKLERGDTVDRYTVEKLLGAGGTAVVYRVRHNQLGTRHALKLLTISGESIKRRLLQEGKAQATLGHLNIVSVTDVVEIDGQPGLLMEYIDGPSLEDALHEYRLTLDDAETLFRGVLAGVRAAHALGIVHRDLKPANVLLAPTDQGFVPKVTDFGLAKAVRGEPMREGTTRQGVAMGTPSYMAPEQIRDAGNVDERADLFSLGCILYEVVTRQRAFPGDDTLDIYNNVANGRYVPPRTVVPDVPERLAQAIRGCLQVDRERRIPDCDTLLAVLLGERLWEIGEDPDTMPPAPRPPTLGSEVPPITLAPRGEGGATPAPAPRRRFTDSMADPTLPPHDARRNRVLAAALVLGSLGVLAVALLFAVVGVSVPVLLAPSAPEPVVVAVPEPAVEPVPAEPAPAEPTPTEPVPVEPVAPERVPSPRVDPAPRVDPVPAPPSTHAVKIFSVPLTAAIEVDGKASGRATNAKLDLPAGRHRIGLVSAGQRLDFDIRVGPGQPDRWCAVFATGAVRAGDCPRM